MRGCPGIAGGHPATLLAALANRIALRMLCNLVLGELWRYPLDQNPDSRRQARVR